MSKTQSLPLKISHKRVVVIVWRGGDEVGL